VFYVPGEHDVATDNGVSYLQRYGKGTKGGGWYSFDHSGVHFVGLVNVLNLKAGGLGSLGAEQIAWLKRDVAGLASSTPIVLFAHVPLWTVYPEWGWGTDDSEQALALLKRFGSVTVLNGHIHQIMQKVEGHVSFHTALSTAFPQPAPGTAPSPGPLKVEPERLKSVLGITNVTFVPGRGQLARGDDEARRRPSGRGSRAERDRDRQLRLRAGNAHGEARHEGRVDQRRRRAASDRERGRSVLAVEGARHEPAVHRDAELSGNIQILLLAPPADAGQDRGGVRG
jgi:Icc protein